MSDQLSLVDSVSVSTLQIGYNLHTENETGCYSLHNIIMQDRSAFGTLIILKIWEWMFTQLLGNCYHRQFRHSGIFLPGTYQQTL